MRWLRHHHQSRAPPKGSAEERSSDASHLRYLLLTRRCYYVAPPRSYTIVATYGATHRTPLPLSALSGSDEPSERQGNCYGGFAA